MEIMKVYPERLVENKVAMYGLTKTDSVCVKDVDDREALTVKAWVLYSDVNAKNEEHVVLSILTEEMGLISTISETFKREFLEVAELMGDDPYKIIVLHGKTKNDREFVTCRMVCDYDL